MFTLLSKIYNPQGEELHLCLLSSLLRLCQDAMNDLLSVAELAASLS